MQCIPGGRALRFRPPHVGQAFSLTSQNSQAGQPDLRTLQARSLTYALAVLIAKSVLVGRSRLLMSPGIALIGGEVTGARRVPGEVTQVTSPGARRLTAHRAEDGVPQAATAEHTFARIDPTGLIHDWSAGQRPRRLPRRTTASVRQSPEIARDDRLRDASGRIPNRVVRGRRCGPPAIPGPLPLSTCKSRATGPTRRPHRCQNDT
jgi:hypothetical protein